MFVPKEKTVFHIGYRELEQLMTQHLPTIDMFIFCQDGPQYFLVDVGNDIVEPEEWRKELMTSYTGSIGPGEALRDYLSLLCYDKVLPPGDYLVAVHW